jgi:hypothetical protein
MFGYRMAFSRADIPQSGDANTPIFQFVNSLHANVAAAASAEAVVRADVMKFDNGCL